MSKTTPATDLNLEHTRVRYHGIGRTGWYITTSTPSGAGITTTATDGPFDLDDLESRLAAIEGGSSEQNEARAQLPAREQVIEEGLISRIETATLDLAEKINARTSAANSPIADRKKALEELMTATALYHDWCDQ